MNAFSDKMLSPFFLKIIYYNPGLVLSAAEAVSTNYVRRGYRVVAPCVSVLYFNPVSFFAFRFIYNIRGDLRFSLPLLCVFTNKPDVSWLSYNLQGHKEHMCRLVTTPTLAQKRILVKFVAYTTPPPL